MVYADYKFYHIISRSLSFSENVIYALYSAIEMEQIGFIFFFVELMSDRTRNHNKPAYVQIWSHVVL